MAVGGITVGRITVGRITVGFTLLQTRLYNPN